MRCPSSQHGSFIPGAQLVAALVCVGTLTACAGDRASESPPATAATEPEQNTAGGANAEDLPPADPAMLKEDYRAIDETAETSERIADRTAAETEMATEPGTVPGTPPKQQTDLEQATAIRKALIEGEGLSASARKVNVLVDQGRVTLRGRVESVVEKHRVEEMARIAAGSAPIVNELEVGY